MVTFATMLWQPNDASLPFSRCYNELWVERLFRGFARNTTHPFRFVVFTDRNREFAERIDQIRLKAKVPDYSSCIEPYSLNGPMIVVGLDTVITGNIDHMIDHCMTSDRIALPRDPYMPQRSCNGVALVPPGQAAIARMHRGENDMEWLRTFPHELTDDLFPGQIQSFKGAVKAKGLGDTRICYFHGQDKPHQLPANHPILEHWR